MAGLGTFQTDPLLATSTRSPARCPSHPFLFWGEGSPKIDYRKSWYPYSNLSTGGPSQKEVPYEAQNSSFVDSGRTFVPFFFYLFVCLVPLGYCVGLFSMICHLDFPVSDLVVYVIDVPWCSLDRRGPGILESR